MFKGIGRLCPDCEAEVCEKIAKGRKIFNLHGFEASIKYDADKARYECTNRDGFWISYNGENWIQAESLSNQFRANPVLETDTKKGTASLASESDVAMDAVRGNLLAEQMSKSPWGDLPPTQQKIHELMGAMKDLLLYKNQKYGDSAINPKKIFYKGDSTNSILIRLDDKIGRVTSNTEEKPRVNDVCDIIGYCTLLLISMGVTAEDIAKFKD
jgi:hypothetical protein